MPLDFHPDVKQMEDDLINVLEECIWIDEIAERDTLFFLFFRIMMEKYSQLQFRFKIPKYQYFSGYNKLVTAFLN